MTNKLRLIDLGEREIVKQLISPRCAPGIGSDCATLPIDSGSLIVTTDPVPPPAAEVIGGDGDPYWKGWLLVTINASDLSAAGAEPMAFFAAVEASPDLLVEDFERFLSGIEDSCEVEGLQYAGGNIREGSSLSAVGTAIGWCPTDFQLSRMGISAGDYIGVVGIGGLFWFDALRVLVLGEEVDKRTSPLFSPRSQSRHMRSLLKAGVLSASMDNSDGLLSTIVQLANANSVGAELHLDWLHPPPDFDRLQGALGLEPERLWLGWGDWNVVVSIREEKLAEVEQFALKEQVPLTIAGRFTVPGDVLICKNNHSIVAPRLESERFSRDSWFQTGIDGYIKLLRGVALPT